jgi:hypothetical protein
VISVSDGIRGRLAFAALAACTLWSAATLAGEEYAESDTLVGARVLAAQGAEAFEQRDFLRALELFRRASAIIQAPTITLMEARTLVELGRLVEALEKYAATQRMLDLDPNNDVFRQAADAAARETEPILQRIPTLRVRVHVKNPAEKFELLIDGRKVPPQLAAVDRPFDPGPHRVEVRGSSGAVATREVMLAERAHEDVELELEPAPPPRDPIAAPAPAPERTASTPTLGWVIAGSGLAFTAVGAITGVMALNHKSELDAACRPGCPASSAGDIRAFRSERTLSYVGFGLGALGLGAGAYLIVTSSSHPVALHVTPNLVTVAGNFR